MSLDLTKLGFRVKKASSEQVQSQTATVSAVILSSGNAEVVKKAQALLAAQGLELTEVTEFEDGTIALHKEDDAFMDGGTIVRMNANMAVVLSNMGEHLKNLQKSAFGEVAEANGYFDGPSLIMATANEVIQEGVQKADTPTAAATLMRDSMESVQQYLGVLTMALPSSVFKTEASIDNLLKGEFVPGKKGVNPFAKKKPAEGTAAEEIGEDAAEEDAEVAAGAGDKKKPVCKDEPVADPKSKKRKPGDDQGDGANIEEATDTPDDISAKTANMYEDPGVGKVAALKASESTEEGTEEVLKVSMTDAEKEHMAGITDGGEKMAFMQMDHAGREKCMAKNTKKADESATNEQMEKVLKAMSDMAFAVATLTKNVGTLSADITQIKKSTEEKIDVLAKKAETATTAVRGTVLASETPGDPQPVAKIKKTDSDPRSGVFDSAMLGRTR